MLGQAVSVSGQLVSTSPNVAQPSVMQPRHHGRSTRKQRVEGSTYSPRLNGPYQVRQTAQRPNKYHPGNVGGVLVAANPYWNMADHEPPSPTVHRGRKVTPDQPVIVSDAQAAAQANGATSQHYPLAGVYGLDAQGQGDLVPVLSPGEVRWSANCAPALSHLNVIGSSRETGHQLSPVMNSGAFGQVVKDVTPKRRNWWNC